MEQRELLETAREGSEDAYAPPGRAPPLGAPRPLLPDARLGPGRRGRPPGGAASAPGAGCRKFEGRSSLRSWLYRIATNTCLDAIERRPKRILPIDYGPPADPHDGVGEPLVESVWIEPYPDETLGHRGRLRRRPTPATSSASPSSSPSSRRSSTCRANQRAVLILREVLGFSAQETADTLDTSVASVNSALQRARATIEKRLPEQSQQETLRTLGDERLRELVEQLRRRVGAKRRRHGRRDARRGRRLHDAADEPLVLRREGIAASWRRRSMIRRVGLALAFRSPPTASPRSPSTAGTRSSRRHVAVRAQRAHLRGREDQARSTPSSSAARRTRTPRSRRGRRSSPPTTRSCATAYERFGLPDRLD